MSCHGGPNITRDGLVFHIDMADDRSYEGAPATNLCPTNNQYYMPNHKEYSGTGYSYWQNYTTWSNTGVADGEYITISGEMKVSPLRKKMGGQTRMYIWTASTTDGWIRSSSWGTTSTEWVPFKISLQRRDAVDKESSANVNNGDAIYVRFGCYHYPGSNDYGTSYLRNVMINTGSEALPFTDGTRTAEFKDFFGRKNLSPVSFLKGTDTFFGIRNSRASGKELPEMGTSSYISATSWPSELNSDSNTESKSWEVIFKTNGTPGYQGIYGHKTGTGCSYYCNGGIYIWNSNISFNWYDNSAYQFLSSNVVPNVGNYYHVVGTYDAIDSKTRIYVNGTLKNTYGSATNFNYSSGMLYVESGYNSKDGGKHYLDGTVPVMKFYKGKALSRGEVQSNYNAYKRRYGL